jgi:hypothetical protein
METCHLPARSDTAALRTSPSTLRLDVAGLLVLLPDEDDRGGWLYSPHALLES